MKSHHQIIHLSIGQIMSSTGHQVGSKHSVNKHPHDIHHERVELDSHADTTVLGRNCVILQYTGRECEVSPYSDTYESI